MASSDAHRSLESLLVATDFSSGAAMAVERAARLPLARGASVHILHVLPSRLPRKLRARADAEATEHLGSAVASIDKTARAAGRSDLRISSGLGDGQAYVEIIHGARRRKAGLIVIGRHGKRPIRDLLIGSTAERVVREGDVPVLVVNLKAARAYHRPLVAVELADDPRTAQGVIDLAAHLVDTSVSRMLLLHAFDIPFEGRMRSALDHEGLLDYRRQWKDKAAREVRQLQSKLLAPRAQLKTVLRPGDPRTVILREAQLRHVDLLVLGTHGRSGIAHALLGSVATWVIRSATCDVAIQRPRAFRYEAP